MLGAVGRLACVVLVAAAGCRADEDRRRAGLERILSEGGVTYCGYECRSFAAERAECRDPRSIEGLTYYECTVTYAGSKDAPADVCAAYVPSMEQGYVARDTC